MTFAKGQRVHVEFDGTIRATSSEDDVNEYVPKDSGYSDSFGGWGFVEVEDDHQIVHVIWVNGDSVEVIEPLAPKDFPPQAGDLWHAEDKDYFITDTDGSRIFFVHNVRTDMGTVYAASSSISLVLFEAIEPELIHRVR